MFISEEGLRSRPLFLQDLLAVPAQAAAGFFASQPAETSSTRQQGGTPLSAYIRPLPVSGDPLSAQEETIVRHRELFEKLRQPPLQSPQYEAQVEEHWEKLSAAILHTPPAADPPGKRGDPGG